MRRRGIFIGFDFPFGFYVHRVGPFRAFEPWRFPRREEYLKMLEEYKRDLEGYKAELEEELKEVTEEIERLKR
ncbi:MAG: hypothetical protein NZ610_02250 [Candidatus Bipolaricaulota bacterium]|nr:hypothetical protein [Candidatus Bipolaricaulota bacterium]MCS7274214.1 hypothetical protein [Candidatus Bipolaricaulota bacterium]MDW8110620.1 hypothetical protein [Candidatus Bipolaricaulota bacterium]MDW8328522.1 hypothetical protein [Candidatus Bipolaricaulota bacterium]